MENQHQMITGYRDLSQDEIDDMNKVKAMATQVGELVEELAKMPAYNQRWVAEGRTDLQKGFMSLTRAIAQPLGF